MAKNNSFEMHSFYCIRCGHKVLDLPRKPGHQYKKFHRKKLYCTSCREEVNCIECRNQYEINEFKENYENGVYQNESQKSLDYVRSERQW